MKDKFKEYFISSSASIRVALKQLEKTHRKILFVVDSDNLLKGSLTDGDIRRIFMKEINYDMTVKEICNKKPITVNSRCSLGEIKEIFLKYKITGLPVVNPKDEIIDLLFWDELFDDKAEIPKHNKLNIPVLIMAGGQGTRLEPFTKILPKPLLPVGEKSIIEVIIDTFLKHEVNEFYITIKHKAKIIKSYFDELNPKYKIEFVEEKQPLGTIGALSLIKDDIRTSVLVTNCDIVINADFNDFYEYHEKNKYGISLIASVINHKIPYGICEVEYGGELKKFSEKPEHSFLASTGMYIIERNVMDLIPNNAHFHITQLIEKYKEIGGKVGVYTISENSWFDTGEWSEYKKVAKQFNQLFDKEQ